MKIVNALCSFILYDFVFIVVSLIPVSSCHFIQQDVIFPHFPAVCVLFLPHQDNSAQCDLSAQRAQHLLTSQRGCIRHVSQVEGQQRQRQGVRRDYQVLLLSEVIDNIECCTETLLHVIVLKKWPTGSR